MSTLSLPHLVDTLRVQPSQDGSVAPSQRRRQQPSRLTPPFRPALAATAIFPPGQLPFFPDYRRRPWPSEGTEWWRGLFYWVGR